MRVSTGDLGRGDGGAGSLAREMASGEKDEIKQGAPHDRLESGSGFQQEETMSSDVRTARSVLVIEASFPISFCRENGFPETEPSRFCKSETPPMLERKFFMNSIVRRPLIANLAPAFRPRNYAALLMAFFLLVPLTSHGRQRDMEGRSEQRNWNTAGNWTPATVPNGSADTATFNTSSILSISLPLTVDLDGMVFNASANAFTFTIGAGFTLSLAGNGITNNSTNTQSFVTAVNGNGDRGFLNFSNSATAGDTISVTNSGATASGFLEVPQIFSTTPAPRRARLRIMRNRQRIFRWLDQLLGQCHRRQRNLYNNSGAHEAQTGFTNFNGSSNAGGASFINNPAGLNDTYGGATNFYGTSSALIGNFANNGATVQGAYGGETFFHEDSTAANGTFGNNGSNADGAFGGRTWFFDSSNADNGTFNNNVGAGSDAGLTSFGNSASAGNGLFFNAGGATDFGPSGGTFFNDNSTAGPERSSTAPAPWTEHSVAASSFTEVPLRVTASSRTMLLPARDLGTSVSFKRPTLAVRCLATAVAPQRSTLAVTHLFLKPPAQAPEPSTTLALR